MLFQICAVASLNTCHCNLFCSFVVVYVVVDIGRDGKIIARYDSKVTPDSLELTKAIEAALAAK